MHVSGLVEQAPAKVNLYLHITGKRADGYHLLKSLFVFCEIADTLSAQPAQALSLTVEGPFSYYLSGENLVMKAAQLLKARAGVETGAILTLNKQLPVASGIGGGSADAAAALRLLARLWKLELSQGQMESIALELGADVPACLTSAPRHVEGVGELLSPAPLLPPAWLVLVHPAAALMTAEVFREFKGPFVDTTHATTPFGSVAELAVFLKARYNALQQPAMRLQPRIHESLEDLAAQPGCLLARMSGSGAACFGLFDQEGLAAAAAEVIQRKHPAWWVRSTRIVS